MFKKAKIGSAIASAAILGAAVFTPAFASSDFSIEGNGYRSDNVIRANLSNSTVVNQTNNSNISNDVHVSNNTGGNRASGNTGGDVSINTGSANANVDINNSAGMNVLNLSSCGSCSGHDTSVDILGNGSRSDNRVLLNENNSTRVNQTNNTRINNDVNVQNDTGHNSANNNTGGGWWFGGNNGDVSIDTGDANADVNISNEAGKNVANLGSCGCGNDDIHAVIAGNGSKSDNRIDLDHNNNTRVNQNNHTDFDNDVNVHNNTGYNNAKGETFGLFLLPILYNLHNNFYPMKHHMGKYFDRDGNKKYDNYLSKNYGHNHKNYLSKFPKHNHDMYNLLSSYHPYMKDGYDKFNKYPWYGNNWWDNDSFGGNSGGNVSIYTGDANADVNLDNAAGSNWLSL